MNLSTGFKITAATACLVGLGVLKFGDFETFIFFGAPLIVGVVGSLVLGSLDSRRTGADHIADIIRIYFALHLIWTSVRYWMTDMQPAIDHPIAKPFLDSLTAMGLFQGIKALEGIVGLMLLFNRYVPLMLVIQVPTSFTIFYLNTFITAYPRQLITGPLEISVNCILLLYYFQYYRPFLAARTYAAPPFGIQIVHPRIAHLNESGESRVDE